MEVQYVCLLYMNESLSLLSRPLLSQVRLFGHRVPDHGQFCTVAVLLLLLLPPALFHIPDSGVYPGDRCHHRLTV